MFTEMNTIHFLATVKDPRELGLGTQDAPSRPMHVVDLTPRHLHDYLTCLEDREPIVQEGLALKQQWYSRMKDRGLGVKLALDDSERLGGMIQYLPVESTAIDGHELYVVLCIWVHGHKTGRGNFQGHGMGTALLAAAEFDARERGAKGMVAYGSWLPIWMRASWFEKHGYEPIERQGALRLLWKPFSPLAVAPHWLRPTKLPLVEPEHVTVTAFNSGWCPIVNATCERARRACQVAGDASFRAIDTTDPLVRAEWGILDALYIDGKEVRSVPTPSVEKLSRRIQRKSRRHHAH